MNCQPDNKFQLKGPQGLVQIQAKCAKYDNVQVEAKN